MVWAGKKEEGERKSNRSQAERDKFAVDKAIKRDDDHDDDDEEDERESCRNRSPSGGEFEARPDRSFWKLLVRVFVLWHQQRL